MKLPDQYLDVLMQVMDEENGSIMKVCEFMADSWLELGPIITKIKQGEENWTDQEATGKAHAWFIESSAAEAGKHPTSMYDRMRVGRNIIHRGLHIGEWSNLKFGHWCALMRNIEQEDDQLLIPEQAIKARLEWMAKETDAHEGQPPSVRDIQDEFRRNGDKAEWKLYWQSIVRNANKMVDIAETPNIFRNALWHIAQTEKSLLSNVDADYTGGMNQG